MDSFWSISECVSGHGQIRSQLVTINFWTVFESFWPWSLLVTIWFGTVFCGHNLSHSIFGQFLINFCMCFWPWSHLVTISHTWFLNSFWMFWPWWILVAIGFGALFLRLQVVTFSFWPVFDQFLNVFLAMATVGHN